MLRLETQDGVLRHAAERPSAVAEPQVLDTQPASESTFIRWAPLFVPVSGGAVLLMAFIIWSAVL